MALDRELAVRRSRHTHVARALAALGDDALRRLVDSATVLGTGIGGTHAVLTVDDVAVFVKRVPLTEIECRAENVRSTANVFELPVACQYGIGSPSFGAWREVAANEMARAWELGGLTACFPVLHHWQVVDRDGPLASADGSSAALAVVEQLAAVWRGSDAVRRRVEAIAESESDVVLFLERIPFGLADWLRARIVEGGPDADAAIENVERRLRSGVTVMNGQGLFHFDAHMGNLLTDGRLVHLADLGLATSPFFALSPSERTFLTANASHDIAYAMTRLVDWLVTELTDVADWRERDDYVRDHAAGAAPHDGLLPAARRVLDRFAPVAVVVNAFYRDLRFVDPLTPYPTAAAEQVCADAGLAVTRW